MSKTPPAWRRPLIEALLGTALLAWMLWVSRLWPGLDALMARPGDLSNVPWGLGSVLLHAGPGHLFANCFALWVLWPLSRLTYPRASWVGIPMAWIFGYAAIWWLGQTDSQHLGASTLTYGLMSQLLVLGLLHRSRPAIAAAFIVCFLFGGAWWSMLPGYPGVSWEGHLGGAIGGMLAALMGRRLDPDPFPPIEWDEEKEQGVSSDVPPAPLGVWLPSRSDQVEWGHHSSQEDEP